jgi:hypothetical protein
MQAHEWGAHFVHQNVKCLRRLQRFKQKLEAPAPGQNIYDEASFSLAGFTLPGRDPASCRVRATWTILRHGDTMLFSAPMSARNWVFSRGVPTVSEC